MGLEVRGLTISLKVEYYALPLICVYDSLVFASSGWDNDWYWSSRSDKIWCGLVIGMRQG